MSEVVLNACELMNSCAPFCPAPEIVDTPEIYRARTGIPSPIFNAVFRSRLSAADAHRWAEDTAAYFRAAELPMEWWITDETEPANMREILGAHGYHRSGEIPAMALHPIEGQPPTETGLSIRQVVTPAQVEDLHRALGAFAMSEEVTAAYLTIARGHLESGGPFEHWVGYVEDEPVSCAAAFYGSRAAGIYSIATLSEFRGRGFGSQVTAHALRAAAERGFQTAVLTSSKLGLGVYRALGFREVGRIEHWSIS